MSQHTVYLFYAPANQLEADQLQQDLQARRIGCVIGPTTPNKVEQLQRDENATAVLLVSDNYLKDLEEMNFLSQVFAEIDNNKLMPVVTHGRRAKAEDTEQMEVYATEIGTLNDVMRYRDYWYEEWIALRKLYKSAPEAEQAAITERKEIAKEMSVGSISSHIRHINKLEPLDWDSFCANDYNALLKDVDTQPVADAIVERGLEEQEELTTAQNPTAILASLNGAEESTTLEEEVEVVQEVLVEEQETAEETTAETEGIDAITEALGIEDTTTHEYLQVTEQPSIEQLGDQPVEEQNGELVVINTQEEEDQEEETYTEEEETTADEALGSGSLEEPKEENRIPIAELTIEEEEPAEDDLAELDSATILELYDIEEVDDVDVLFHIAEAQLEEDQTADARYTYERILQLDPYNGRALIWLARLLAKHDDQAQTLEAAHTYRKAIMVNDDNAQLYYEYGLLQKDAFQAHNKAVDAFREALTIDAYYEDAYFGLAQCQRELGQREAAKANYLQACLLDADRFQTAENDNYFDILRHRTAEEELPAEVDLNAEAEAMGLATNPNAETVVLVTGATSGIGQAIAGRFIMDGYKVILAGRRTERLDDFRTLMEEHLAEAQVHCLTLDVREPSAVQEALQALPESWQGIDILINNAGLAKGFAPIHEGDLDHWETMIDTNLKGLLYVSRAVTPGMVERRRGHVINIGSVAGVQAYSGGGVYCATKAAVDSLTRSMRLDLYEHNIKVTAVHPGHVENTEFAEVRYDDASKAKIYEDFKPLSAKDVADTVYYVATRPEHVNIQNVLLFGTQQASATDVDRSGREDMVIG